ncbi:MAG: hypothetical protein AAGF76_14485, partial [Pseudomonadota bacterium]
MTMMMAMQKPSDVPFRKPRSPTRLRIPRHSDSRSADIRTWIPGHPDNLAAAAERELLMSVVTSRVKVEGL